MSTIIEIKNSPNATPDVCRALANCPDGSTLVFPEGEYHFHPEGAFEKHYYISNNRHGLKRVAFPIIGKKNISIDGRGARFIFHGEIIPVVVEESEKTVLRNFSVDWERPFYSQGTITKADASGVTLEIDRAQYPYHFEDGEMIFEGEGWARSFSEGVFEIDPSTGGPAYLSGDAMGLGITKDLNAEEAGASAIRLNKAFPHLPTIGNILLLRHYRRSSPGIHLKLSNNTLIENVTIHHAGGMGVIGQFCENITVRSFTVSPSVGRFFSVTVDATHFVNCRGLISLEDCRFEGQLDDASNIHGINTRIQSVLDEYSLITELVHHEQHGVEIGFPGDRMTFSNNQTLLAYTENTINAIEQIDERTSKITFKNKLPDKISPGHVLENMSWAADVHISGCTARNNRARSLLISTPGKVVIENNRMESSGSAIKISGDANFWFEAGAVRDVLIRNNEFGDCCFGPELWGRTVIDIDPEIPAPRDNPECFHRNIRIENNRFFTFDTGILFARSVEGITFAGNTIRRTDSYPMLRRTATLLTLEACRDVVLHDNHIEPSIEEELIGSPEGAGKLGNLVH